MNRPAHFPATEIAGPARFTAAEFLQMTETGAFADMRIELIEGELVRMTPPMNEHAGRQAELLGRLWAILPADLRGRLRGEIAIDLGDDTIVACDAALLATSVQDHRPVIATEITLVIEVAMTTLDRDLSLKRLLYAAAGIPHYWVVDGKRSVIHVFGEPADGDYATLALVPFGSPLAVPGTDAAITLD